MKTVQGLFLNLCPEGLYRTAWENTNWKYTHSVVWRKSKDGDYTFRVFSVHWLLSDFSLSRQSFWAGSESCKLLQHDGSLGINIICPCFKMKTQPDTFLGFQTQFCSLYIIGQRTNILCVLIRLYANWQHVMLNPVFLVPCLLSCIESSAQQFIINFCSQEVGRVDKINKFKKSFRIYKY